MADDEADGEEGVGATGLLRELNSAIRCPLLTFNNFT